MRPGVLLLAAGALVIATTLGALHAQDAAPALTAAQQCEVERVALQAQVVELRAQLVALQTQLDRQQLERERARLEGTLPKVDGQRWDWATLRFVPTKEAR